MDIAHRRTTGGRRSAQGQALAELALVTPLLALLIMAIFQFAFVLQTQIGLTNAVREAARRAAAAQEPTQAWVAQQLCTDGAACTQGLLPDNVQAFTATRLEAQPTVTFCSYSIGSASGEQVTVSVGYNHPVFFPLLSFATDLIDGKADSNWTLDASAQMKLETDLSTAPGPC